MLKIAPYSAVKLEYYPLSTAIFEKVESIKRNPP
jgi:hypothetical protein